MQRAVAVDELAATESGADAIHIAWLDHNHIGALAAGNLAAVHQTGGTGASPAIEVCPYSTAPTAAA